MIEKSGIGHERVMLLHTISERNLSNHMDDLIMQRIANSAPPKDHATREAEAARINAIIDSSKTEAEIMEKLSKL